MSNPAMRQAQATCRVYAPTLRPSTSRAAHQTAARGDRSSRVSPQRRRPTERRKNSFDDVLQRSSMRDRATISNRRPVRLWNQPLRRVLLDYEAAAWGRAFALSPAMAASAAFASATVASEPARVHSTIFDGESSRNALSANGSTMSSSAQPGAPPGDGHAALRSDRDLIGCEIVPPRLHEDRPRPLQRVKIDARLIGCDLQRTGDRERVERRQAVRESRKCGGGGGHQANDDCNGTRLRGHPNRLAANRSALERRHCAIGKPGCADVQQARPGDP